MNTLLEVIQEAPGSATAVILPEQGIKVNYSQLRERVQSVADSFASAGIAPGDRVAMSLPNGLDTIVCFLAASIAGTAAPLNPGYRYDEFLFYLEDTNAKLLVVPPQGADEARRAAAERKVPVITAEVTANGKVHLSPSTKGKTAAPPDRIVESVEATRPCTWKRGIATSATSFGPRLYVPTIFCEETARFR